MTIELYDVGDCRRITGTFTVSGTNTDPTTVTFTMVEPDGTETTVNTVGAVLKKSATGIYYVDWTIDQPGRHEWHWSGTGAVIAADSGVFFAEGSVAA